MPFEHELKNAYIGYWWTPWSNTLAYYPLNSTTTVNDQSWNGRNLTNNNSVTFGTYHWVDCADFNSYGDTLYNYSASWLPSWKVALTVSVWVYYSSVRSGYWEALFSIWNTNHHAFVATKDSGNNKLSVTDYGDSIYTSFTPSTWQWRNMVFTAEADSNTWKVYINGVEQTTSWAVSNYAWLSGTNFRINGFFWDNSWLWIIGNMSEFIFENKTWNATQVADYYNSTKSNYWIS